MKRYGCLLIFKTGDTLNDYLIILLWNTIMISSLFELAPRVASCRSWSASPGPGRIDWIELNRVACGWIYGDWISGVGWR